MTKVTVRLFLSNFLALDANQQKRKRKINFVNYFIPLFDYMGKKNLKNVAGYIATMQSLSAALFLIQDSAKLEASGDC